MTLDAFFMGQARERWAIFASGISLLEQTGVLPLAEPIKQTEQELYFKWKIEASNLELALKIFKLAGEQSLASGRGFLDQLDRVVNSTPLALKWDQALLEQDKPFSSVPYTRILHGFLEDKVSFSSTEHLMKVILWSSDPLGSQLIVEARKALFEYSTQKILNPSLNMHDFLNDVTFRDTDREFILELLKNNFGDDRTTGLPAYLKYLEIYLKKPNNFGGDSLEDCVVMLMGELAKDSANFETYMPIAKLVAGNAPAIFGRIISTIPNPSPNRMIQMVFSRLFVELNDAQLLKLFPVLLQNNRAQNESEKFLIKKYPVMLLQELSGLINALIDAGRFEGAKQAALYYSSHDLTIEDEGSLSFIYLNLFRYSVAFDEIEALLENALVSMKPITRFHVILVNRLLQWDRGISVAKKYALKLAENRATWNDAVGLLAELIDQKRITPTEAEDVAVEIFTKADKAKLDLSVGVGGRIFSKLYQKFGDESVISFFKKLLSADYASAEGIFKVMRKNAKDNAVGMALVNQLTELDLRLKALEA